jgi:hypothetical protein
MKFDTKDIIIAFLLVLIVIIIFGRQMSFANEMKSPGTQSENDATGMPSGAILPKAAEEVCSTKYGAEWIDFSPMLCKKK